MTINTAVTNKPQQSISRNKLLGVAGVGWLFDAMDVGILSLLLQHWLLSGDFHQVSQVGLVV